MRRNSTLCYELSLPLVQIYILDQTRDYLRRDSHRFAEPATCTGVRSTEYMYLSLLTSAYKVCSRADRILSAWASATSNEWWFVPIGIIQIRSAVSNPKSKPIHAVLPTASWRHCTNESMYVALIHVPAFLRASLESWLPWFFSTILSICLKHLLNIPRKLSHHVQYSFYWRAARRFWLLLSWEELTAKIIIGDTLDAYLCRNDTIDRAIRHPICQ